MNDTITGNAAGDDACAHAAPAENADRRAPYIERCLPFVYRRDNLCSGRWQWESPRTRLCAVARYDVGGEVVRVTVYDNFLGLRIRKWSSVIRLTSGHWQRRLRRAAGEAMILAQRRPLCPGCVGKTGAASRWWCTSRGTRSGNISFVRTTRIAGRRRALRTTTRSRSRGERRKTFDDEVEPVVDERSWRRSNLPT